MPQARHHIQGLIFAALGASFLTPDGLLVRLSDANDWTVVFWRGFYVGVFLLLIQQTQNKSIHPKHIIPLSAKEWLSAALAGVGTLTFVLSITHTTVANALVILSTMSLFAALLSVIFLRERIALHTWIAMIFALIGILVVFGDNLTGDGLMGKIYALICAFVTAANMTLIRSKAHIRTTTCFGWGGLIACIPALILAPAIAIDTQTNTVLLWMAGLNALAFFFIGLGAQRIPSPEVTLLMLIETIIGPIWVWAILSEQPSTNAFIGGAIVVLTLAVHSVIGIKKQTQKNPVL
jgi:drug/metabolite transporter (DMT)-like permease